MRNVHGAGPWEKTHALASQVNAHSTIKTNARPGLTQSTYAAIFKGLRARTDDYTGIIATDELWSNLQGLQLMPKVRR